MALFRRLGIWDFTRKEPEYSYMIVITTYWQAHGNTLERMFLTRLKSIWTQKLRNHVKQLHDKNRRPLSEDLITFQTRCKRNWEQEHKEFPFLLEILQNKDWIITEGSESSDD